MKKKKKKKKNKQTQNANVENAYPNRGLIENYKKIAKKFKKLKNTIKASFQAKIGRKGPRKRENKNY